MSTWYVGEIRILPYRRGAPDGWLVCDGSQQSVATYNDLFTLIGTTYGGDGATTFCLPDLRGRVPVHRGYGPGLTPRQIGSVGGAESISLQPIEMGQHTHSPFASTRTATSQSPAGAVLAGVEGGATYYNTDPSQVSPVPFAGGTVVPIGGGVPHENMAPTLVLQYCIATNGVWPAKP